VIPAITWLQEIENEKKTKWFTTMGALGRSGNETSTARISFIHFQDGRIQKSNQEEDTTVRFTDVSSFDSNQNSERYYVAMQSAANE
jgi:hypothetical protein